MNLKEIVNELEKGSNYNPNLIKLTFKEGERVTDYAKEIYEKTNNSISRLCKWFIIYNFRSRI